MSLFSFLLINKDGTSYKHEIAWHYIWTVQYFMRLMALGLLKTFKTFQHPPRPFDHIEPKPRGNSGIGLLTPWGKSPEWPNFMSKSRVYRIYRVSIYRLTKDTQKKGQVVDVFGVVLPWAIKEPPMLYHSILEDELLMIFKKKKTQRATSNVSVAQRSIQQKLRSLQVLIP